MPDSVTISINAKTLEGLAASDPEVIVDVIQTIPFRQTVSQQTIRNFPGSATIAIPTPDGFPTWLVNISFSKFDAGAGFFFQPRQNASPTFAVQATRLPGAWKPEFTALDSLATLRFADFLKVISVSKNVDLKNGPPVGDLSVNYDLLADAAQKQGKMALLNLFAVLTDEQDPISHAPWFNHVRKIVRLDQERFIAEVEPALFENVQTILQGLNGEFKGQGFFTEPPSDSLLHIGNIPPQYGASHNLQTMITLKKDYEQGDLQLTLAFLIVAGQVVHLLDCDMDENRNLALHSLDIVKHWFNGGTSPVSMHEYIVEDSAQNSGGIANIDLGYQLA
jgi:hypothetical protein